MGKKELTFCSTRPGSGANLRSRWSWHKGQSRASSHPQSDGGVVSGRGSEATCPYAILAYVETPNFIRGFLRSHQLGLSGGGWCGAIIAIGARVRKPLVISYPKTSPPELSHSGNRASCGFLRHILTPALLLTHWAVRQTGGDPLQCLE